MAPITPVPQSVLLDTFGYIPASVEVVWGLRQVKPILRWRGPERLETPRNVVVAQANLVACLCREVEIEQDSCEHPFSNCTSTGWPLKPPFCPGRLLWLAVTDGSSTPALLFCCAEFYHLMDVSE